MTHNFIHICILNTFLASKFCIVPLFDLLDEYIVHIVLNKKKHLNKTIFILIDFNFDMTQILLIRFLFETGNFYNLQIRFRTFGVT